jgi:DNA-binding transcriptional MerR regulator/effector-binding domain-containing protein
MRHVTNGLLAIGAFSRASALSIKALRVYHEAGILIPARVDPVTGYRTYHSSQLIDAAVIVRLRSLDLPLDEVRTVVLARDPDVTSRVLAAHESTMRSRLAQVQRIVVELHEGRDDPASHTPVHLREQPHRHTLALRGQVDDDTFAGFLRAAHGQIGEIARSLGVEPVGPFAALFPPEIPDDGPGDIDAHVPIAEPVAVPRSTGLVLGEVPATPVAVLVHAGPYDTIADTYRRLGSWVAEHAAPRPMPVREVYVVGAADTGDPHRFRTEIHWPVASTEEKP